MSQMLSKWMTIFACTVLVAVGLPLIASAATINMILSDVDVIYQGDIAGGSIYDTTGHNGGNQDSSEADELEAVVFELDMSHVGTLMKDANTELYGDLKVDGAGATLSLGSLNNVGTNGGNFGFEFFTDSGESLQLGIDDVDVLLTNGVFFFTGEASVLSQNLPFGLVFDTTQPVFFSYSATLPGIIGNPATMAIASGAMTISGTQIPEPTTLATLALGLALSGASCVRRRSRR